MKKKHIIIPIVTAFLGILIGAFFFGGTEEKNKTHETTHKNGEWTCSMHPQIRKSEPGDCPICGMDLIPLKDNGGENPRLFQMSEDAIRIANIQTTVIGNGNVAERGLTLSGRLVSDETSRSSLVTHIPGRIEKLYVSFTGDHVSVGQRIAKIYSSKLISAQGELLEAYKVKDTHPELLEAAKNKLRYWKISNQEITSILKGQKMKEYFDIRSEYNGVITQRRVNVGDHLGEGEVLFDLQNLNSLWAEFDVYEQNLSAINVGDKIQFTTPGLPGKEFTSKIVFIDPVINPSTRTAAVRLEVPNSEKLLKPDMFVSGTLIGENEMQNSQLLVPKSAVLWTGERSVVYVKLPGADIPTFEYSEVNLGESLGDMYVVKSGLKSGDEVVTNGAFVIDASAQLNNRASMMNKKLLGVKSNGQPEPIPDFKATTPLNFKKQLQSLLMVYLDLKNALVASKVDETKANAKRLEIALDEIDMKLLNGESHAFWMKSSKTISIEIKEIIAATKLNVQRNAFARLSDALINSGKAFGLSKDQLYIQYCPMANKKQGGSWISAQKDIRNPYFGEQMLTCGEVKDSITP